MKLVIQLVTWNSATWLPYLFASLKQQTLWNVLQKDEWKLLVWDNASEDNTVFELERLAEHVPHEVFSSVDNVGFAVGHNALFRKHDAEYTLLLNPDIALTPDTLEVLYTTLKTAKNNVAGVTARLMRGHPNLSSGASDSIDSLGLEVKRSRRVVDIGAGESWTARARTYTKTTVAVFGISGALPFFRTQALRDVAFQNGDLFAAHFHTYKEDVDLAFRLASRGYTALVCTHAVARHARGSKDATGYGATLALKKFQDSDFVRLRSYRNHWYTLIQNEYGENVWRDFVPMAWYELTKFGWHVLFAPKAVFQTVRGVGRDWPKLMRARKEITKHRRVSAVEMRAHWLPHERSPL